jgi:hypothetical protein
MLTLTAHDRTTPRLLAGVPSRQQLYTLSVARLKSSTHGHSLWSASPKHLHHLLASSLPLASQPSHTEQALTRGQALHAIAPRRGALRRTYNTPGPLRLAVSQALHRHLTLVPENHAHRRQRMSRMVVCKAPNGTTSSHDASLSPIFCPIELPTHMATYNMTWLCWPVEVASLSYLLGFGAPSISMARS